MEFDTSTFILEIINFLVLLRILQRFFYKPLLDMIAKRKQYIDDSLASANQLHQEAEVLKQQYENRQKLWEQEKQVALKALQQQIEQEKASQLHKLRLDLEQEREKAQVALSRQQQDLQRQVEQQAFVNSARFAGQLLQQAAGPELETRLFNVLLEQLQSLPENPEFRPKLLGQQDTTELLVRVVSVYPLTLGQREQLQQQLGALIATPVVFQYDQMPELIAGLRIDIGAWILDINLKYELAGFAKLAYAFE